MDPQNYSSKYLKTLQDLHNTWKAHEGQSLIIKELAQGRKNLFIQCGRKFGKSELVIYLLWRKALLEPNSSCYYLAPFMKQAKEIIWASRRIQNFISNFSDYVESTDNTELRIRLKNGSFIKVDGSDNFEAYRGITPDFVVYDEFKDFRSEFHEAMSPNLASKNAPLVIIGTPPKPRARNYKQYINLADEFKADPTCFWIKRTSYDNPHISHDWLNKERDKLIARGEEDIWQREYLAEIVGGGRQSLFPMFNRAVHLADQQDLINKIKLDYKKWEFYAIARPSATTCFAALFIALHTQSRKIIILDELYEQDKSLMSSERMVDRINSKCFKLFPKMNWLYACTDEAPWFSEETMVRFDQYFTPVKTKGEEGISLLKDILRHNLVIISNKCQNLIWEMENYVLDEKNRLPKEFDYAIECLKVLFSISYYSTTEIVEIIRKEAEESKGRYLAPRFDPDLFEDLIDWTGHIDKKFR